MYIIPRVNIKYLVHSLDKAKFQTDAEKGVKNYTVKGGWQLDNAIQSKVMALVFSMAAKIERDLISKRTKEVLQSIKLTGDKLGRPKSLEKQTGYFSA